MQPEALSAAVPREMQELSASRQTWYMGRHGDRIYWVYTPASYQAGTAVPLIMVLHGCMQPFFSHPWAIAYDTHMNQLAEAHQFLVVYPHQFAPPDINPISCWNFFLPENQHRDEGEPASLAGIVQDMLKNTSRWTIDPSASMWPASPQAGARSPIWEPPTPIFLPPSRCTRAVSTATTCRLSASRRRHEMPWRP